MKVKYLSPALFILIAAPSFGQGRDNLFTSPGILGTLSLIAIVLVLAVLILSVQISSYIQTLKEKKSHQHKLSFTQDLIALDQKDIDEILMHRKAALSYQLSGTMRCFAF